MGVQGGYGKGYKNKVGEGVGSKWKNKTTIRSYAKPSNPNTAAQQTVRGAFKEMTQFVALFSDQLKYKTALDTSGMSVRNAIIKANKAQIADGTFDPSNLVISKGGLQSPQGVAVSFASGKATVTWTTPTASNFTANALAICVVVDKDEQVADVFEAKATEGTATGTVALGVGNTANVYFYFLDKRGSNKVASISAYTSGEVA
jgi:hypothetical protein